MMFFFLFMHDTFIFLWIISETDSSIITTSTKNVIFDVNKNDCHWFHLNNIYVHSLMQQGEVVIQKMY